MAGVQAVIAEEPQATLDSRIQALVPELLEAGGGLKPHRHRGEGWAIRTNPGDRLRQTLRIADGPNSAAGPDRARPRLRFAREKSRPPHERDEIGRDTLRTLPVRAVARITVHDELGPLNGGR